MAKNKALINRHKILHQKISDILPRMYAAMAIALWNTLDMSDDDKQEAIGVIFAESQAIWQECADNNKNMIQMCEEITGIDVLRTTT